MTDAQDAVLKECCQKLGEHFDKFVLITEIEIEDGNDADIYATHSGGYYNALGLLAAGQHHYLQGHGGNDEQP